MHAAQYSGRLRGATVHAVKNTSFCAHAGEELIGARAYRVIFAALSLPLATLAVAHFINHRSA